MKLTFLWSFCFASLALSEAISNPSKRSEDTSPSCLTQDTVNGIIDGYAYLLTQPGENPEQFNSTALNMLTDDFQVFSDSILMLSNHTLGQGIPAYPSRDVLLASQFNEGIAIPVMKTLDVFFGCTKIAWRCTSSGLAKDILPVNMIFTFDVLRVGDSNATVAEPAGPVPVEILSTAAESTIGSPSNSANLPSSTDSDTDEAACAPGVSLNGNPNAGECPSHGAKVRRSFAALEDYERPRWRIQTVYSEFNTGAWIRDLGGECAMPAAG